MDKLRGMETFIAVVESGSFYHRGHATGDVCGDGGEVHHPP